MQGLTDNFNPLIPRWYHGLYSITVGETVKYIEKQGVYTCVVVMVILINLNSPSSGCGNILLSSCQGV